MDIGEGFMLDSGGEDHKGGFYNLYGAKLNIHGKETSGVVTKGPIRNIFKKGKIGGLDYGFCFSSISEITVEGSLMLKSLFGSIINHASSMFIDKNLYLSANQEIKEMGDTIGKGKNEMYLPCKITVNGNATKVSKGDIKEVGSYFLVGGNSSIYAGKDWIVDSIKLQSTSDLSPKVLSHFLEKQENKGLLLNENEALAAMSHAPIQKTKRSNFDGGGFHLAHDRIRAFVGGDVKISGATVASSDTRIESLKGDILVEAKLASEKHQHHWGSGYQRTHSFYGRPSLLGSFKKPLGLKAHKGKISNIGSIFFGDTYDFSSQAFETLPMSKTEVNVREQTRKKKFLGWTYSKSRRKDEWSVSEVFFPQFLLKHGGIIDAQKHDITATDFQIGDEELLFSGKELNLKPFHQESYYRSEVETKGVGLFGFFKTAFGIAGGKSPQKAMTQNTPFLNAIAQLAKTESLTDAGPAMNMAVEFYKIANHFAADYEKNGGNFWGSLKEVGFDQLGIQQVGPVVLPTTIGFYKKKFKDEVRQVKAYVTTINGKTLRLEFDNAHIEGGKIRLDDKLVFNIKNSIELLAVKESISTSHEEEANTYRLGITKNGLSLYAGYSQGEKEASLITWKPILIEAKDVDITVAQNMLLQGNIKGETGNINVGDTLTLETKAETIKMKERGEAWSVGATIGPGYTVPELTFSKQRGEAEGKASKDPTTISFNKLNLKTKKLILDGSTIEGEEGNIEAPTIEYANHDNYYHEEHDQVTASTSWSFLGKMNFWGVGNGLLGLFGWGHQSESTVGRTQATISDKLNVETKSDIFGLNRDPNKAVQVFYTKKKTYSMTLPIFDIGKVCQSIKRIKGTADDVVKKMSDYFSSAKEVAQEDIRLKRNIKTLENIHQLGAARIEAQEVPEDEKIALQEEWAEFVLSFEFQVLTHVQVNSEEYLKGRKISELKEPEVILLNNDISHVPILGKNGKVSVWEVNVPEKQNADGTDGGIRGKFVLRAEEIIEATTLSKKAILIYDFRYFEKIQRTRALISSTGLPDGKNPWDGGMSHDKKAALEAHLKKAVSRRANQVFEALLGKSMSSEEMIAADLSNDGIAFIQKEDYLPFFDNKIQDSDRSIAFDQFLKGSKQFFGGVKEGFVHELSDILLLLYGISEKVPALLDQGNILTTNLIDFLQEPENVAEVVELLNELVSSYDYTAYALSLLAGLQAGGNSLLQEGESLLTDIKGFSSLPRADQLELTEMFAEEMGEEASKMWEMVSDGEIVGRSLVGVAGGVFIKVAKFVKKAINLERFLPAWAQARKPNCPIKYLADLKKKRDLPQWKDTNPKIRKWLSWSGGFTDVSKTWINEEIEGLFKSKAVYSFSKQDKAFLRALQKGETPNKLIKKGGEGFLENRHDHIRGLVGEIKGGDVFIKSGMTNCFVVQEIKRIFECL